MIRRWACALLLPILLSACTADRDVDAGFETAVAQRGDLRDIVPATGEIREPLSMAVPILLDARITAIMVRLGQRVRSGQVLATLAPLTAADDMEDSAAEVTQADIQQQIAANRYAKAEASYAGLRQLHDRGFVPDARLLAEQKELENERLGLVAARQKRAALDARSARLGQRHKARDQLIASCDCVVEDINVTVGQSVSPTLADAFYLSGGGDALTIRARVPEQDLSRAQTAGEVRFGVEALPDRTFSARIDYISNRPVKDGRFTYYTVYLRFDREDATIRPGMTANIEFVNADSRNVLSVPIKALYFTPEGYVPEMDPFVRGVYQKARTDEDRRLALAMASGAEFGMLWREGKRKIFVLEKGGAVRRLVRVGAQTADNFEVVSGLRQGEVVVLASKPSPR